MSDGLNEERLVELSGTTLWKATLKARAQSLVGLAKAYAAADPSLAHGHLPIGA